MRISAQNLPQRPTALPLVPSTAVIPPNPAVETNHPIPSPLPASTFAPTDLSPPASTYAPSDLSLPTSPGIPPAGVNYPVLVKHFKVSNQQAFLTQQDALAQTIRRLHNQQPSFQAFVQTQLEQAFPDIRPLNTQTISFNRYQRNNNDTETLAFCEPLMKALGRMVRATLANPNALLHGEHGVRTEFMTRQTPADDAKELITSGSLQTIARTIAMQYPATLQKFWATPRPTETQPEVLKTPQNQLLTLHKTQLSTLAALRVSDGTLSADSKRLIDIALQYPTLAEREKTFANGARPGVYPVTLDKNTERGALLAGSFLITSTDGSATTPPTWPNGKALALNDANGSVVLYTSGEGFEEFATPAQAREALAKRLDQGGATANLLLQTLPFSLQNQAEPPSGQDLMLSVEPLAGDVLAEAIPLMLQRQQAEIDTRLNQVLAPALPGTTNPLEDPAAIQAIDEAADWSYLLDGSNAMLARDNTLADKQQPEWLKKLTSPQEAVFTHLERIAQKATDKLIPLLEKIPSLAIFSRDRLNEALKKQYPTALMNADQLMVQVQTKTHIHLGHGSGGETPFAKQSRMSLTDLALKNPSGFAAGEHGKFTDIKMALSLTDTQGKPVLDAKGEQVKLNAEALKNLVNTVDVGGEYTTLLKTEMATDTESGSAAQLRATWKTSLGEEMAKEAFLAQLNPDAYTTQAAQDSSTKRAAQWVAAVLDHPDPASRPQVDGKTVVANTLIQDGLPVQGVMVIGNRADASLVLYTPNAPDSVAFREVTDPKALDTLLEKKQWRTYTANRKSPVNKGNAAEFKDALKERATVPTRNPADLLDLFVKTLKITSSSTVLKPIEGNVQDHLYKQHVQRVIDKADHQSVSSAQVAAQSRINKIQFGIDVALIFLDLLPVISKGVSTGLRLGKAAVTALRANNKLLPHLIKNPGLARAIYADFSTAAAGIPNIRAAPMRPVFQTPTTTITGTSRSGPKALTTPEGPAPALASTSTGVVASSSRVPTVISTPGRDLSAFSVSDELIRGHALRPDGTYNVGNHWYVRFTDSNGVNKVYQIDSAFHARSGQVNIVDPNAPLTTVKGSRIKASLQSAGNGEWRLNEMAGGKRHTGRASPPAETYMDRVLSGAAARDITGDAATTGQIRRWFRRDMSDFYDNLATNGMPARPPLPVTTINSTPQEAIQRTLAQPGVRGLVVGELHEEPAAFQLLIDQMQTFRNNGVTTLYLEGAPFLQGSPNVADAALLPSDSAQLGMHPYSADYTGGPTMLDIIEEADKHGIKVVGIEHRELTWHVDNLKSHYSNNQFVTRRLEEMNYYAAKIIEKTPPGEKYVALVGKNHMNTYASIPGVAELTGGVGISVSPTPKGSSSLVSNPPHTPPASLKFLQGFGQMEPHGDLHIDYNIDALTA